MRSNFCKMKKIKFLIVALAAVTFLVSCNDESGEYARYTFTNAQKKAAITKCLNVSLDSALTHLCANNGFYSYNNNAYRIDYSDLCAYVFDTLQNHGYGDLTDSLVLYTNVMAQNCKVPLDSAFTKAIKSLEFSDYDALITGDDDAITNYLEYNKYREIKSYLQSPVSIRMNVFHINDKWNAVMTQYQQYNSLPVNVDLQGYIIDGMIDAVFSEMRVQESIIRNDSVYRAKIDSTLGVIFERIF